MKPLLIFPFLLFFTGLKAQTLTYVADTNNLATFTLSGLDSLVRGEGYFTLPRWEIFLVFGDGDTDHFFVLPDQVFQEDTSFVYSFSGDTLVEHQYPQGISTFYQAALLAIERKSDDPPPAAFVDFDLSQPLGIVQVKKIDITDLGTPTDLVEVAAPLLPDPDDKAGLDYSHKRDNANSPTSFLRAGDLGVFTLAFKPENPGATGHVIFFYNSEDTVFHMPEPLQRVEMGASVVSTSTLIPHYSPAIGATQLGSWLRPNAGANYLTYSTLTESDLGEQFLPDPPTEEAFQNFVSLFIPDTLSALGGGAGNSDETELRLLQVLQNDESLSGTYPFALAYYEEQSTPVDTDHFSADSAALYGLLDLPRQITVGNDTFHFQDAARMNLMAGEPSDPNSLRVQKICQCAENQEHRVFFELEFCNSGEVPATGANILLEGARVDGKPALTCFRYEGTDREESRECCHSQSCQGDCARCQFDFGYSLRSPDERYCLVFPENYPLAPEECTRLRFSAILSDTRLDLAQQDSLVRYCVNLHFRDANNQIIPAEMQECGASESLADADPSPASARIWKRRNNPCGPELCTCQLSKADCILRE